MSMWVSLVWTVPVALLIWWNLQYEKRNLQLLLKIVAGEALEIHGGGQLAVLISMKSREEITGKKTSRSPF